MGKLSISVTTAALAWLSVANPEPTVLRRDFDPNGWTPAPTPAARLLKRQGSSDLSTCGYVSGIASESLTCDSGICGYDLTYSWFGCCSSTTIISGTVEPAKCPVVTDCVDYEYLSQCASSVNCASNTAIRKCTDTASPYCAALALLDFTSMYHYLCAETPFITGLYLEPTGAGGSAGGTLSSNVLSGSDFQTSKSTSVPSVTSSSAGSTTSQSITSATIASSATTTSATAKTASTGLAGPTARPGLVEVVGVVAFAALNLV